MKKKGFLIVLAISAIPPLLFIARQDALGVWGGPEEPDLNDLLCGIIYSFVTTATLFYGCSFIIHNLHKELPWEGSVSKRLLVEILLIFSYSSIAQILIIYGGSYISLVGHEQLTYGKLFDSVIFGNTITLIVVTILEGNYFLTQWKESLIQNEKVKRESIKSQYNSLKSQLDPHFLFNSLNVLSSLIKKDTDKAEHFVDDFAKVYRYVLDVKNEMVVHLVQELDFLKAYMSLQKIRFGKALELEINISATSMKMFVPPLSLQELVNNAVKHNEVSVEKPLKIILKDEDGMLHVSNNLQMRMEEVNSTGLGLENLEKRYSLLNDRSTEFRVEDGSFIARIPLLEAEE